MRFKSSLVAAALAAAAFPAAASAATQAVVVRDALNTELGAVRGKPALVPGVGIAGTGAMITNTAIGQHALVRPVQADARLEVELQARRFFGVPGETLLTTPTNSVSVTAPTDGRLEVRAGGRVLGSAPASLAGWTRIRLVVDVAAGRVKLDVNGHEAVSVAASLQPESGDVLVGDATPAASTALYLVDDLALTSVNDTPDPEPAAAQAAPTSTSTATVETTTATAPAPPTPDPVPAGPVLVGSPFAKGPYARNVWDMQAFMGRLYLGHGNSSNRGPESNAGPTPIVAFDPATSSFSTEGVDDDEQIDRYTVMDGQLWSGTHDPHTNARTGFFRRDASGWTRKASLSSMVLHVYDVIRVDGVIYAAGGDGKIHRSTNDGATWTDATDPNVFTFFRVHELFEFRGQVYASSYAACAAQGGNRLFRLNRTTGRFMLVTGVTRTTMFPDFGGDACLVQPRMLRPEVVGTNLVYIGAEIDNDHQWIPRALYRTASPTAKATKIALPTGVVPYDISVQGDETFVLGARKLANRQYVVSVWRSSDLVSWSEVVSFPSPTFARSFERLGGAWYFGLGTNTTEMAPESGQILRYP